MREIVISCRRLATYARLNATYHMDGPQWLAKPMAEKIAGQDF
jgi:hypothetical protein